MGELLLVSGFPIFYLRAHFATFVYGGYGDFTVKNRAPKQLSYHADVLEQ